MGNAEASMAISSKTADPPVTTKGSAEEAPGSDAKPRKKICCACPETKKLRDECIVEHGETACSKWIEAHRQCLRAEGFKV
ncbi:cytochrome c oxidase copper chaperone 1-like [Typha angustifolia]|uniref:cytochrome c oxidase copper chaperone 1-like n=1 Tax=Typha angustifolia TaxID=59011 RepID=UPI003C3002CD